MVDGPEHFLEKGRKLMLHGEFNGAIAAFSDFLEESNGDVEPALLSEVLRMRGWAYERCSQLDRAAPDYKKAFRVSQGAGDNPGMADALRGVGHVFWEKGQYEDSNRSLQKALDIAKRIDDQGILGRIYLDIGNYHNVKGDIDKAMDSYRGAIRLLEKAGNLPELARAYSNLGDVLLRYDRVDASFEYLQKSLDIAKVVGDDNGVAWAESNLAEYHIRRSENTKGIILLETALANFERVRDMEGVCHVYRVYGLSYMSQQEWSLAGQALRRSLKLAEAHGIKESRALASMTLGEMLQLKGDKEGGREHLERALEDFMDLDMKIYAEKTRTLLKKTLWS